MIAWNGERVLRLQMLFRVACSGLLLWLVGCSPRFGLEQCQSTEECLNKGFQDSVCTPDHYCQSVYSVECRDMLIGGPLQSDSILIAMMTRLEGTSADLGKSATQAARLALDEMASEASALPVAASKSPRKLRLLLCNDGNSAEDAVRIAGRLVNELGIQVIMGPFNSGYTLEVARRVTIPGGALMLNPFSVTPLLTELNDQGLVWRTSISNKPEGPGMALLAKQLEGKLRKEGILGPTAPMVVATVARGDTYGRGITEDFRTEWTTLHSGLPSTQVDVQPFQLMQDSGGKYPFPESELTRLQDAKPHLVILAGTQEMESNVMVPLEKLRLDRYPYYFASEGTKAQSLATAVDVGMMGLRERMRVVAPTVLPQSYELLSKRIKERYNMRIQDGYGVANSYDAVYLLGYGLALLGDSAVTGAGLAQQLERMSAGVEIKAGPSDLARGHRTLLEQRKIDFKGVSGELDFDPKTGESKGTFDILCVRKANPPAKPEAWFEPLPTKIVSGSASSSAALSPTPTSGDQFEGCQ